MTFFRLSLLYLAETDHSADAAHKKTTRWNPIGCDPDLVLCECSLAVIRAIRLIRGHIASDLRSSRANLRRTYIVSTTRNSALPLIMRA